jgi:type II secretion system-associated lipoprotein
MRRWAFAAAAILVFLGSCGVFLRKEDSARLKDYEKREYVLRQDVSQGSALIKKGQRVRVQVIAGSENIKVYCREAGIDILKADRVLILYLFEDDFPKKEFDAKHFEEKLFAIIE